jgi:4-hydroxybenzoate polyprenyltransferase
MRHAKIFGTTLLLAGLLTGYLMFPREILHIYVALVLLNALYSAFARTVPYLEIAVNAATYPLRYMMGAVLAGGALTWPLLLLTFLVAVGSATLRRRVELAGGIAARPSLKAYSVPILILIEIAIWPAIGVLRLADRTTPNVYYVVAAAAYAVFVLLPEIYEPWRLRWQRFWSA